MPRRFSAILLTLFALFAFSSRASAQSWSFDARTIGMGGVGSGNLATKIIDSERDYTAIVIPIGLFQVLSDTDVFDPNNIKFSKYKGFVPASNILAEGLVSPDFGFTIKVHKGERGSFQGIYIGAG